MAHNRTPPDELDRGDRTRCSGPPEQIAERLRRVRRGRLLDDSSSSCRRRTTSRRSSGSSARSSRSSTAVDRGGVRRAGAASPHLPDRSPAGGRRRPGGRPAGGSSARRRGGLPPDAVVLLEGAEAADRIDGLGRSHGWGVRLLRLVQFTTMDQMPDFHLYEAAIADGRAVVAVRVRDAELRRRVRDRLASAGAHFMNFYGRLYTEELSRWSGPELAMPGHLRR